VGSTSQRERAREREGRTHGQKGKRARASDGIGVDSSVPPAKKRGSGCTSARGRRDQRRQVGPTAQREGAGARGRASWTELGQVAKAGLLWFFVFLLNF
jgi:hypothetical protein